jgi:hypothetical protein
MPISGNSGMSESVDAYRGGSGRWDSRKAVRTAWSNSTVARWACCSHTGSTKAERTAWGAAYQDHACVFAPEDGMPYNPTTVTKTLRKLAIDAGLRPVRLHEPSVLGPSPSKDAPAFRGSASPYVLTSRSSRLAASSTRPNKVPGFLHRHPTGLAEPETSQATRMQQQSSPRRRPTISRWNAQPQRPTSAAPAA